MAVSTLFAIMRALGTECTEEFAKIHSKTAWRQLDDFQIGVLDPADVTRLQEQRASYPEFFDTSPAGSTRASTGARALPPSTRLPGLGLGLGSGLGLLRSGLGLGLGLG